VGNPVEGECHFRLPRLTIAGVSDRTVIIRRRRLGRCAGCERGYGVPGTYTRFTLKTIRLVLGSPIAAKPAVERQSLVDLVGILAGTSPRQVLLLLIGPFWWSGLAIVTRNQAQALLSLYHDLLLFQALPYTLLSWRPKPVICCEMQH